MSALTEVTVAAPTLTHLPWWRGRLVKVVAIVGLMVIVYQAFKLDYPWPTRLTFTSLSAHLDELRASRAAAERSLARYPSYLISMSAHSACSGSPSLPDTARSVPTPTPGRRHNSRMRIGSEMAVPPADARSGLTCSGESAVC